jgi:hypothetical protein
MERVNIAINISQPDNGGYIVNVSSYGHDPYGAGRNKSLYCKDADAVDKELAMLIDHEIRNKK